MFPKPKAEAWTGWALPAGTSETTGGKVSVLAMNLTTWFSIMNFLGVGLDMGGLDRRVPRAAVPADVERKGVFRIQLYTFSSLQNVY